MSLNGRLTIHYLLVGLRMGLFLVVQTLFLLDKGVSLATIGLLMGAYSLTAALLELPLGALADLHGRIRVYRWSLAANAGGMALALASEALPLLFAAVLLLGLGRALNSGTVDAWLVERYQERGEASALQSHLARFQATLAAAIGLGAAGGGYLPDLLGATGSMAPSGWNLIACLGVAALHGALTPWLFRDGDPVVAHAKHATWREPVRVAFAVGRSDRVLRAAFGALVLVGLALIVVETYWQPLLRQLDPEAPYRIFGWLTLGYFAAGAAGPALLAALTARRPVDPRRVVTVALAASAISLGLLAAQRTLPGFAVCYLLFMGLLSTVHAPLQALIHGRTGNEVRSTIASSGGLFLQAGVALASVGGAALVERAGIAGVWGLAALLVLLGTWGVGRSLVARDRACAAGLDRRTDGDGAP